MRTPSRYNGIIEIPLHWTPQQADAVTEFLGLIDEAIWNLYGDDLVDLAQQQHYVGRDDDDFDHPDDTEEIPF